ncbi:NAD(P)H-dependent flavin oxidoreductase [Nocardia sp. NPDC057353]|uniref:NAD(P)H-dependent flavin oxidoreductase n=1 Tax=Nocardia sp. NPDC057353 TaxID=3346104 RepID=UPI0036288E2A
MIIDRISLPIVLAPMAGGPSTPELTAAVTDAGGLGLLAAGYLGAEQAAERIAAVRELTSGPFGVNLFAPGPASAPAAYAEYLAALGARFELSPARHDSDGWSAKLELLVREPVPVVTVTFGCPEAAEIERLHGVGTEIWVTVTSAFEAELAAAAGADVLVVQGAEAGGHRAVFRDDVADDATDPLGLLALLQVVGAAVELPLVATGGLTTGAGIAGALAAGAVAAQVGTAYLRSPEAGTNAVHRAAIGGAAPTALTRAFTGRRARGIRNAFMAEFGASAPVAYPEIHYATAGLRAAARAAGNPDAVNLWAGQAHTLAPELPAGELTRKLAAEAKDALKRALSRGFRAR